MYPFFKTEEDSFTIVCAYSVDKKDTLQDNQSLGSMIQIRVVCKKITVNKDMRIKRRS